MKNEKTNQIDDMALLKSALDNGMIDLTLIQNQINMKKERQIIENHPYSIWEDKNGNWKTYLPDKGKKRVLIQRKSQSDIWKAIVANWEELESTPTVEDVFNEWNDWRRDIHKISESSHLRYGQVFRRHFSEMGKRKISDITELEWDDFLEGQILEHKLGSKAFNNLKAITMGLLKRAKRKGLADISLNKILTELDISDKDFKKVYKKDSEKVFMEDELPIMLNYLVENPELENLAILLMFITGMRVGEVVCLTYADYDEKYSGFYVSKTETRYKKNGTYVYEVKESPKTDAGYRLAIIPRDYEWIYQKMRLQNPFGEYIFVEEDGSRCTTNAIRQKMYRICKWLGISQKSPHKARRTYASILLDNNLDDNLITTQMGHTDISTTEIHYHENRRGFNTKKECFSDLPEFQLKAR